MEKCIKEHQNVTNVDAQSSSLRVNLRLLALFTLGLWITSHALILTECGNNTKSTIIVKHFIVNTKTSNVVVREGSQPTARASGFLPPQTHVETIPYQSKEYEFIIRPITGFILRSVLDPKKDEDIIEIHSFCPIDGWRITGKNRTARFTFAPTNLVFAQQLWNALQVMEIFLSIGILYRYQAIMSRQMKIFVSTCTMLLYLVLLPASIYVISPGAIVFSVVTVITITTVMIQNIKIVLYVGDRTSVGETKSYKVNNDAAHFILSKGALTSSTSSWMIISEEMLGFICNLCSSLYNYHSSQQTWPHWLYLYHTIDTFFGWNEKPGASIDVFSEKVYTLGLTDNPMPTYIPRSVGSTFGSYLFILLWSIIPFLYISYFLCMYIIAERAPGVKIQRILLIFGIFHFLFLTDAVDYKYGRGLRNPYAETFHWFERFIWRIAVLMPIYQNCCTGHWKQGYNRFPVLGNLFHYAVACWGILFFILQLICSDLVRLNEYLHEKEDATFFDLLDFEGPIVKQFKPFSYHGALVIMWIMYAFLILSGFTNYYVSIA